MSSISDQATQAGRTGSWWWDAQVRLAIRHYQHHRDPEQLKARLDHLLWLAEHSNIRSPR